MDLRDKMKLEHAVRHNKRHLGSKPFEYLGSFPKEKDSCIRNVMLEVISEDLRDIPLGEIRLSHFPVVSGISGIDYIYLTFGDGRFYKITYDGKEGGNDRYTFSIQTNIKGTKALRKKVGRNNITDFKRSGQVM